LHLVVEVVEHAAGLDTSPALGGVDLQHLVEMTRAIQDDARTDTLPRLRSAAAARGERHTEPPADLDGGDDVRLATRMDHAQGYDLVDAGVGGVNGPAQTVKTNFSGHVPAQGRL